MAKKILKTLTNNIGYKLLAVLFAFVMWLMVYNIDDPDITKTFTVNVTVTNAQNITDMDKCYEILDGTGTVSFRVTAKREIINKLDNADFTATADMTQIVLSDDNDSGEVPITITANMYASSIRINNLPKYLMVGLEDLQTKQFMIAANTKGDVEDGFALGAVTVTNPNVIKVSGPASIVGTIDKVTATIDVDGMSSDISDNVIPEFYDEDGKKVNTSKLQFSNSTVTITARILSMKEIPLQFHTTGTPADSYTVKEITCEPEKIKIKGSAAVLNPLTVLDIPEEVLNIDGADKDIVTTINVTEYLPDGVELVNSKESSVEVTVSIDAYKTQSFDVSTSNLTVEGLDDNYNLSFVQSTVAANISGNEKDLEKLSSATLKGTINVASYGEGTFSVAVTLNLDAEKYKQDVSNVQVNITKKVTNPPESNNTNNQNGSQGEQQGASTPSGSDSGTTTNPTGGSDDNKQPGTTPEN